jgi:hypothetical protein
MGGIQALLGTPQDTQETEEEGLMIGELMITELIKISHREKLEVI